MSISSIEINRCPFIILNIVPIDVSLPTACRAHINLCKSLHVENYIGMLYDEKPYKSILPVKSIGTIFENLLPQAQPHKNLL